MTRSPVTNQFLAGTLVLMLTLAGGAVPAVERVRVMGLFKDRAVLSLDGRQRVLFPGKPTPEGVTLIEANSRRAVVEIDGETRTLILGDHISGVYTAPVDTKATVHLTPDPQGMYFVSGSINGFQLRFLVDTGATHIAINSALARRIGIPFMLEGREAVTATASGITESYEVTLDRVRVGDIALKDVAATVIDGPFPAEALLGMSFLGQVEINRDGQMLELRGKR